MQGKASLLTMVMFGYRAWNALTSASHAARSDLAVFGGWQPTEIVTLVPGSSGPAVAAAPRSSCLLDLAPQAVPVTASAAVSSTATGRSLMVSSSSGGIGRKI
ncbi:hypothetical protein Acsp03_07740 [Actinomadura sp. NBRC 104412]|nr:hypothetical protein Acsp03_07740 [Actinomadura sp. NBRC 104412]